MFGTDRGGDPWDTYFTSDVVELYAKVFVRSCTMGNITSSFRATGSHPFNPNVITDDMFFPSVVNDILQQPEKNSIRVDVRTSTQAPEIDEISEAETLLNLYFSVTKSVLYYTTQQQYTSPCPPH